MSEDQFSSLIKEITDGNLVTHFVMILEVLTDDGMDLRIATSETLTAWQALGMLEVANDMIGSGYTGIQYDDKDDEE